MHSMLGDFRAFWCAGSTLAHGADPYRAAALGACEHLPQPWGLYSAPAGVAVPAPLPPYAFALFVPLSLLPYPAAAVVWLAVLIVVSACSVVLLGRALRLRTMAVGWMLLLPAAVLWLPYGEATPLALLGAAVAADALQMQRPRIAAAGLMLLAIAPHVALGAWIAAAAGVPRARVPLLVAGTLLLAVSALLHAGSLTEYVSGVLPLHALAEVPRPAQYSATWVLAAFGAAPVIALRAGSAFYAASIAAGVFGALALRRRWNDPAVLIFAPIAASVLGGTFVHLSQVTLALPFAAAIAARERGRAGAAAALACVGLAVPWMHSGQQAVMLAGIALAALLVMMLRKDAALSLASMAAAVVLAALLAIAHRHPAPLVHHVPAFPVAAANGEFASASWGRYIWREQSAITIGDWLAKAPAWIALLVLAGCAARVVTNKEPVVAVGVHEAPALP